MKKKLLSFTITCMAIFVFSFNSANAQSSITIDASQQITNFVFVNSQGLQYNDYLIFGEENLYNPVYSGTYSVGYSYLLESGLFFRTSLGMRSAGATMVFEASNYLWEFQYLQAKLGTGYSLDLGRIDPYIGVSGYFGYMMKANQRVNNEDFDIIDSESILKKDFGLYFSPGVKINASEYISVYSELSYLMGLQNIESGSNQQAKNVAYMITLGLSFNIK